MIGALCDPSPYTAVSCKHFDTITGHCKENVIAEPLFRCSTHLSYCLQWKSNGNHLEYRRLEDDFEYRRTRKAFVSYDALDHLDEELLYEHGEFVSDSLTDIV